MTNPSLEAFEEGLDKAFDRWLPSPVTDNYHELALEVNQAQQEWATNLRKGLQQAIMQQACALVAGARIDERSMKKSISVEEQDMQNQDYARGFIEASEQFERIDQVRLAELKNPTTKGQDDE